MSSHIDQKRRDEVMEVYLSHVREGVIEVREDGSVWRLMKN
jgi:hypothetical protein